MEEELCDTAGCQVGQLWRTTATGSLYRVESIDLTQPDPFERVRLQLVEPGPGLTREWATEWASMTVEPAWFRHGAARLERSGMQGGACR